MKILRWLDKHLEEYFMGLLLAAIAVIMLLQIVMRVMKMSLSWPEEIARYMYVWSVFLSLGFTLRSKSILKVDLVVSLVPKKIQAAIEIITYAISAAFFGMLFYASIEVVSGIKASAQTSPALVLSMYLIYMVVPIGFALATFRSVQEVYFTIRHKNQVDKKEELAKLSQGGV